jgi:hypothetical protein
MTADAASVPTMAGFDHREDELRPEDRAGRHRRRTTALCPGLSASAKLLAIWPPRKRPSTRPWSLAGSGANSHDFHGSGTRRSRTTWCGSPPRKRWRAWSPTWPAPRAPPRMWRSKVLGTVSVAPSTSPASSGSFDLGRGVARHLKSDLLLCYLWLAPGLLQHLLAPLRRQF